MSNHKIPAFLISVVLFIQVSGQDPHTNKLDSISGKFMTALRSHEKLHTYLVTDKSIFTAGESIWFRAFYLNSISQKMNTKSRFLFVDLVNEKDSVVKLVILDAANRELNSKIIIPDSITNGYYWLRAYTRQTAEADTNGICVKPLFIFSKTSDTYFGKHPKTTAGSQEGDPTITFYPEGGNIITGVNSTVALRVSYPNGAPVTTDGFIKDIHDAIIAHFTTDVNGLGKFDFEPSGFRKYKAVINWHGKEISSPLPAFNFFSGQLSATKQPTGYKLRILLGDSIFRPDMVTYLIGVSKDNLSFASFGKGQYEVFVDNKKLPEGITTFYLFDGDYKLLSERSVDIHEKNVMVKMAADKEVYGTRGKVTLTVSITDADQQPIPSTIAVSVIDTLFSDPREQCNFPGRSYDQQALDNIFLTHECLTDEAYDLLMLAHNSTYGTFSKALTPLITVDADSLLYIKGMVLNGKNEPGAHKVLTLLSNSGISMLYTDTTNNKGHFSFPVEKYPDSTQFAMEVRNAKGGSENSTIVLDPFIYPKLKTPVSLKQFLPMESKLVKKYLSTYNALLNNPDKQSLPAVTVKYQKKTANYNESKRVSANSTILTSDDLDERNSVGLSVLKIGGMHLLNGFLVINGLTSMGTPDAGSEPMLLVDGVQVGLSSDIGQNSRVLGFLNSINPKDIDFIEILKGPEAANYGVRGGNGVILVNMLSSRKDLNLAGNNIKIFYAKGISNPVLFPTTDYSQKDPNTMTRSDIRSTLFWNGNFLSGEANNTMPGDGLNKATFTFFTSDIPAVYKATITGITVHGDVIYKTITFQSK